LAVLLAGAETVWYLAELTQSHVAALDLQHVRRWRALPEPLDQGAYGGGLADGEHLDSAIRKVARVAAATQLLRTLTRRRAIENALHAPGHVTAPRNDL
jgi:hypothetical protein